MTQNEKIEALLTDIQDLLHVTPRRTRQHDALVSSFQTLRAAYTATLEYKRPDGQVCYVLGH